MKSILDRNFRYVPAAKTNLAATFKRIRAEQKAKEAAIPQNVKPLRSKV